MDRVKGKVVVVTGGGSGIGRASCLLLAREGAVVAVTDVNDEGGQETVDAILKEGGRAQFWHLDTSKEAEVEKVIQAVVQTFGKISGLVNNAGIMGMSSVPLPTHEISEEQWDEVQAVNVKGVFFCTKHAIPHMLKEGSGSIVNLSSMYGLVGSPDAAPYHASKGAVRLMTKTDALIYAKDKIRVNSVHPGAIWTGLLKPSLDAGLTREMLVEMIPHPLGRFGEPEEIAFGILFLISDESSFMTGSELVMDGGYTAQ